MYHPCTSAGALSRLFGLKGEAMEGHEEEVALSSSVARGDSKPAGKKGAASLAAMAGASMPASKKQKTSNEISGLMLVSAPRSLKKPRDSKLHNCFEVTPLPSGKKKVTCRHCDNFVSYIVPTC